jgi:GAF domain-containing protein
VDAGPDDAQYFADLSRALLSERDEVPTFEHVVRSAVDAIGPCDWAGLTLRRHERMETVASTDELVEDIDAAQYALREGPCVDAALHHEFYLADDLASDPRWPRWSEHARARGVASVLSVQLSTDQEVLGALNLYAGKAGVWSDDALDVALVYTAHATNAMVSARLVSGLTTALDRRHRIGIAEGVLVSRHGVPVGEAFAMLHAMARQHDLPLHRLAEIVVEHRGVPQELMLDGGL